MTWQLLIKDFFLARLLAPLSFGTATNKHLLVSKLKLTLMKVVLIYQKYTQTLKNNFKNAEKKILRKRAVLTSKADYNGMATSNQGFFFPIITTFVLLTVTNKSLLVSKLKLT